MNLYLYQFNQKLREGGGGLVACSLNNIRENTRDPYIDLIRILFKYYEKDNPSFKSKINRRQFYCCFLTDLRDRTIDVIQQ